MPYYIWKAIYIHIYHISYIYISIYYIIYIGCPVIYGQSGRNMHFSVPNVLRCPEWDLSPEVPRPGDFEWSVIAMCDSYAGREGLFVKRTVQIQGGSWYHVPPSGDAKKASPIHLGGIHSITQPSGVKIWWKSHDWNNGGRLKSWKNSPEASHSPWYSPLRGGIPMVSALKSACLARLGRNFGRPLQREEEVWSGSAGFPKSKGAKAMFLLGCFMWYQRDPM